MTPLLLGLQILALVLSPVYAACPFSDDQLKPWSLASSWPSNAVPVANDKLTIAAGTNIVLDVSTASLASITIDGGKLVWGNYDNLTLTSGYILIRNGGQMWVGSEDCKFAKKATISLTGSAKSPNITDFGNKFIGVTAGGTLELHGAAFTPTWTKLSKTVTPISWSSPSSTRGINVAVFDADTANFVSYRSFDTFLNTSNSDNLAAYINALPSGSIVGAFSADEATSKLTPGAIAALQSIGSALIQTLKYRDAWVCIGVKGALNGTATEIVANETLRPTAVISRSVSSKNGNTISISGQSQTYGGWMKAADQTQVVLTLADDVSSWKPGQRVVIASTDQNYRHAEESAIIPCTGCTKNQIKLETPLAYTHWGEFVYGVDERAEVGLLTRNILIQGVMANANDTWGAHTKVMANFTNAHFENVEYYQVGQPILAMYPVHFHMVGDVDQLGGYSSPAYVKGCSVHKSFSRCYTLHGVNGLLVKDNVAYDHVGHCYFIEDGAEMRNQLIHNLGLGTHYGTLLLSERNPSTCVDIPSVDIGACAGPATFWLTNANNSLIGNSAAGSAHMGIWYIFPEHPTGPCYALYPNMAIQFIPMAPCENNVAHSSPVGMMVDDATIVDPAAPNYLGVKEARYRPHELPNLSSPRVPSKINGLTIHHTTQQGVWMRGGDIRINGGYFADNRIGITLASEGSMPNDPGSSQELANAVFVGRSANWFETYNFPVRGYEVYDGPIRCRNCSFYNFVPTKSANISAIGFLLGNNWQFSPLSYFEGAKFDDQSLRVYAGGNPPVWSNLNDGERNILILDKDGSITGTPMTRLVTPYPVHTTNLCTYREDWNMSLCPHKYAQLYIRNQAPGYTNYGNTTKNSGILFSRDETYQYKMYMEGTPHADPTILFQPQVILNKTYTLHWNHAPPTDINIQMTNFDPEDWLRIGVCFPKTANFTVNYVINGKKYPVSPVMSVMDIGSTPNITSYYWDSEVGMLFVLLRTQYARNGDNYCGSKGCESVQIISGGPNTGPASTAAGYCSGAYPKYAAVEPTPPPTSAPTSGSSAQTTGDMDNSAQALSLSVLLCLAVAFAMLL